MIYKASKITILSILGIIITQFSANSQSVAIRAEAAVNLCEEYQRKNPTPNLSTLFSIQQEEIDKQKKQYKTTCVFAKGSVMLDSKGNLIKK